jgi:diguanylate cyclase (GGDEF)-like protein
VSSDQIILLVVGLIVIAAVAVTVAYATSSAARGGGPRNGPPRRPAPDPAVSTWRERDEQAEPATGPATAVMRSSTTFISPASTRQVARVVALLFLAAVAVVVALTRAWPEQEPAIFTLLAAGMLLVVLFMDMVPPAAFGRYRRPMEGIGAIVFLGLLMTITGGAGSPFLVGFYLVAAGTALSSEGRAPLAVALVGACTIAVVGLLDAVVDGPLEPEALAWVGINAVSLILLADIATAAARSQRHARDEALRASRFDALTGLYNRAFFFTTMEQEIRRSDRMGRGFTLLMLDLDDLKPVNDTFGHQWGDRLLKAIADTVRQTVRFTDAAARYGGDEFVVLLPETDAAGGYVVGEKLRRDIHALTLRAGDRNVRSSVSVGLVAYPDDGSTIEQLVAAADVAMYEAKRRGKNRIVGYQMRTERVATDIDAGTHQLVQLTPSDAVRTGGDPVPWDISRSDRTTIRVQPEESAPPPWSSGVTQPTYSPGRPRPEALPPDEPPEPPTRMRTSVEAPDQPWLTRTDVTFPADVEPRPGLAHADDRPDDRPSTERHNTGRASSRSDEIRGTGDDRPWIVLPIEPDDEPGHRRD